MEHTLVDIKNQPGFHVLDEFTFSKFTSMIYSVTIEFIFLAELALLISDIVGVLWCGHPGLVGTEVPRLLINKEVVGEDYVNGFDFGNTNYRDAKFIGACDDGILQLAELLGRMLCP